MPRSRKPKAPRTPCKGSGKPPVEWDVPQAQCRSCYREVRIKADGTTFQHFPKAPVGKSDPKHSKYILATYGITGEQYEAILAAQGGMCFICQGIPRAKRLAVDHDHETNKVRGLLCRRCNHRLLGSAHDDTAILYRAIAYLENNPSDSVLL